MFLKIESYYFSEIMVLYISLMIFPVGNAVSQTAVTEYLLKINV